MREKDHPRLTVLDVAVDVLVDTSEELVGPVNCVKETVHYFSLPTHILCREKVAALSSDIVPSLRERDACHFCRL